MKRDDIVKGQVYTNGKGRFRLASSINYEREGEWVNQSAWRMTKRGLIPDTSVNLGFQAHGRSNVSLTAFARWAQREAAADETAVVMAAEGAACD